MTTMTAMKICAVVMLSGPVVRLWNAGRGWWYPAYNAGFCRVHARSLGMCLTWSGCAAPNAATPDTNTRKTIYGITTSCICDERVAIRQHVFGVHVPLS